MDFQQTSPDFEIGNVESYTNQDDGKFSHQSLVMASMKKCIDAGARDLYEGGYEKKQDKAGNTILIYREDTRKCFIESVLTAEMVMSCDYDTEAEIQINKLKDKLNTIKNNLLDSEQEAFNKLPSHIKQKLILEGNSPRKGLFDSRNIYYKEYIEEQIRISRDVFSELSKLTKRLDFYKTEDFEA